MSEDKRCKDFCAITEENTCCYECNKNQNCNAYNVAKCNSCEIHKEHNYRSITDKFGRITKVSKVKKEQPEVLENKEADNKTKKISCHMRCENMDNQPVCCYQCEKRNECKDYNRCDCKCQSYLIVERDLDEKCNVCIYKETCDNEEETKCKEKDYINFKTIVIGTKNKEKEICNTCRKRFTCEDQHEYDCKADNYCYYIQERKGNKDIKIINKTDASIETNKKSIVSVSTKATKLLKIECILRSCTIDDLIVNLISDKAKAIYDNVVDNK